MGLFFKYRMVLKVFFFKELILFKLCKLEIIILYVRGMFLFLKLRYWIINLVKNVIFLVGLILYFSILGTWLIIKECLNDKFVLF